MNEKFIPTHIITHNKRRIPVRLVDGACYTKAEWENDGYADWEYTDRAGLMFQGGTPAGRWFFDDIKPRVA